MDAQQQSGALVGHLGLRTPPVASAFREEAQSAAIAGDQPALGRPTCAVLPRGRAKA